MMAEFAIGQYGPSDYRLIKYDGSTETEIDTYSSRPDHEKAINSLADYHSVGNTPFSSREGMIDSHLLTESWPVPVRDMQLTDETLPWDDA